MISFEGSIVIERAVEDVFAFVSNPANIPLYQSDVVSSRIVTDGPMRLGTRFEETMRLGPWKLDAACEVVVYEAPRRVAFVARGGAVDYRGEFALEATSGGTRLHISGTGQLKGWWRILTPLMGAEIRHAVPEELARIRACLGTPSPREARRTGLASTVALLFVAVVASTAQAGDVAKPAADAERPAPPEMKKTVDAFSGKWAFGAVVTMPGAQAVKAPLKMTCRRIAKGKAVSCEMTGNIPGSGPLEASFLVGYDTFTQKVHFMAMTSDEEVHDHVCRWSDATHLSCDPLKGGMMAEDITEDFGLTFDGDKASFRSVITMKDGAQAIFEASGKRSK